MCFAACHVCHPLQGIAAIASSRDGEEPAASVTDLAALLVDADDLERARRLLAQAGQPALTASTVLAAAGSDEAAAQLLSRVPVAVDVGALLAL